MTSKQNELERLVNLYCDGKLKPEEAQRLQTVLRDDTEAQRQFLRYMDIHARLSWEFGAGLSTEQDRTSLDTILAGQMLNPSISEHQDTSKTPARRKGHRTRLLMAGLIAAMIFVAATIMLPWIAPSAPFGATDLSDQQRAPVKLVRSIAARWHGPADYRNGDEIPFGRLKLSNGLAVLETGTGARLIIEAPLTMDLIDSGTAFLHSGRVVVRCETPDGFVVNTNEIEVTDKGTEFGVSAGISGNTMIQVYEGKVLADFKKMPDEPARKMNLFAGEAYGVASQADSLPHRLPFRPDLFIRTIPEPDGPIYFKPAYQTQIQSETIRIMEAPSTIVVDGDLSDWDRGGEITGRFDPPYEATYNLKGYMMYDREYLYIGAHIRDPYPLRSITPPQADHTYCYRGGAVQVRLCTDPAQPWPLPQYYWPRRRPHISPEAREESYIHLSMWYYAPEARPCLLINYGFPPLKSFSRRIQGWQGTYQMDADGLGYTLEYAIPWRLIQQDGIRFQPGDETGVCWQVNWSNKGGEVRIAQLNECVNRANINRPFDLIDSWRMSASWGRGLFLE